MSRIVAAPSPASRMWQEIGAAKETELLAGFFGEANGYFVEVGANEPRVRSQTWGLESKGWRGLLIEPQPDLAAWLRLERRSTVFDVACVAPEMAGRQLPLYVAGPLSSLGVDRMAPGSAPQGVIMVQARTLDSILDEAAAPRRFEFLSIDVEGFEIEVLKGANLAKWQPRLVMIEDHVSDLARHRFMCAAGYKLIKRFENNGWYVPKEAAPAVSFVDAWGIVRKYYLGLPFRKARNFIRKLRRKVE